MLNIIRRHYLTASKILIIVFIYGCNHQNNKVKINSNNSIVRGNKSTISNDSVYPQIDFDTTFINLDTMQEGEIKIIKYHFKNIGLAPLIIKDITPSCGCSTPTFKNTPILPGEKSEIVLKFNSKNKLGDQNLNLVVKTNTFKNYYLLKFYAFIKPK